MRAGRHLVRLTVALALLGSGALALPGFAGAAPPKSVTIGAASPSVGNCYPFGTFTGDGGWGPNFAFVYKNVPAFQLKPGDTLAFDLGAVNDFDAQVEIALAPTTANGNDVNAQPFTKVVSTSQTPANPRGNATVGDYELRFTSEAAFSFPGGGLLIRVSNPSAAFALDSTCTEVHVIANASDASGFFVGRRINDPDGVAPWTNPDSGDVAQFRLTLLPTSNAFKLGKLKLNPRNGTAKLAVILPGPGAVKLRGKGVKTRTASARTSANSGGTVMLKIKPKGDTKALLAERNRASVKVGVTYSPAGDPPGDPLTKRRRVKLTDLPG